MNRRKFKKRCKKYMDWFTREKIPLAFKSEKDRKLYISTWARARAGYKFNPKNYFGGNAAERESTK
jgi:hypothetical protein